MRILLIIISFLVFPLSVGCAMVHQYGPYYGKVIDAETKEPIEGAAVLAVYYTESYGPAGAHMHYLDAQETVTGKDGEFKIAILTAKSFRIGHSFYPHVYFTIFKPGYGHYPGSKGVKPMFVPNGTLPANQHVIIEVPKLMKKDERMKMPSVNFDIPYEKQERFIQLLNQEMEMLGATGEYSRESFRGG